MSKNIAQYKYLIPELTIIAFLLWSTLILLDYLQPGFVTSSININLFFVLFVFGLCITLIWNLKLHKIRRVTRSYLIVWNIIISLLVWRIISGQHDGHLLGFIKSVLFMGLLMAGIYLLYDRRSKN